MVNTADATTSTATTVPAQAAAVGYNTETLGPEVNLGNNWLPFNFFGVDPALAGAIQNSDGSVTLPANAADGYGAQISTAKFNQSKPGYFQGEAFGGGGYFQATMSFVNNTATGAPAFWANDIESMAGGSAGDLSLRQWPNQPAGFGDWIEADMAEFDANLGPDQYGIALHNWYGTTSSPQGTSTLGSGSPITVPAGTDFAQPHTYGFLWVPATATTLGYAKWFFDGLQVGNTITWKQYNPALPAPPIDSGTGGSSAYSIIDTRHLALILGNATAIGSSNPGPVTIYNVQVWQNTSANDIIAGTTPQPVTYGTGPDSLVLTISEDAWANGDSISDGNGDATFTVSVDGQQVGGTFTAGASHSVGQDQTFTLNGDWGTGQHVVTVDFLNDAYNGTPQTDRNLYVDDIMYDGTDAHQSAALMSNGPRSFTVLASPTGTGGSGSSGVTYITPGSGSFTDASGNVYTIDAEGNALENGKPMAGGSGTGAMEYVNGIVYGQDKGSGTWYTWNQTTWSLASSAPPPPPTAPAAVTTGSGSDTLLLSISEDAYANGDKTSDAAGDATFTVSVDGKQLAGTFTAKASHAAGVDQTFTFKGNWAPGAHTVAVSFLNDAWAGTAATDRNLYVDKVTYNGTNLNKSAALMSAGSKSFAVTDNTALPPPVTGSGSDMLVVKMSEDYYLANAQFTVAVDGKQLGGTFTATALHSSGGSQAFAFAGDFGAGQHSVSVKFLNDAYAGSPSLDRNLYVNDILYNGVDTKATATLYGAGSRAFTISGGTTPSITEASDHGSLQKNLSQIGTYTVGGDSFVLSSGNAAAATLGTGTSHLAFIGPSSLRLTGGSGTATVTADAGTNTFTAGSGSIDVKGGGGKDTYVFHANSGRLTIEDFSAAKGDKLVIDSALKGSMVQASDYQGGTLLTFGSGGSHAIDVHGLAAVPATSINWM